MSDVDDINVEVASKVVNSESKDSGCVFDSAALRMLMQIISLGCFFRVDRNIADTSYGVLL